MSNISLFDSAATVTSGTMGRSAKCSFIIIFIVVQVNSSYMRYDQIVSENNIVRILFVLIHI